MRIIESGQTLTVEEHETWPYQPYTRVSKTKVPLCDARGTIIGTFGVSRDITERRRIEAAMQARPGELKSLDAKLSEAQNQLVQSEITASVGQLVAGGTRSTTRSASSANLNSL